MAVRIRMVRKGDGKGIVFCFNEGLRRGSYKYTSDNGLLGHNDAHALDKAFSRKQKGALGFVALSGEKVVGACFFYSKNQGRTRHRGELSWGVHPDYFQKGIATRLLASTLKEASRRGFIRAEAEIAAGNVGSIRLAKKYGFRREGTKEAGMLLDNGKLVNVFMFGKLLSKARKAH